MKYLLAVGFFCNVYRKEPRARIFVGDQLIDEFNIQHQPENKDLPNPHKKTTHPLQPVSINTYKEYIKKSLPPLRFYELEIDDQLKQNNIRIDIDNNDNNYTNGFMSRSTLLQFRIIALLPADKNIHSWFYKRMFDRMFTYRYPWYWKKRINDFFGTDYHVLHNNIKWIYSDNEEINGDITTIKNCNIGGSGSLYCNIIKKYGILIFQLSEIKKSYLYRTYHYFAEHIYNKYEQHANQRNTD